MLGFLKSQKFTELLRKYTKVYIGLSAQELNVWQILLKMAILSQFSDFYHESYILKCLFQICGLKYQKSTELKKFSNTEKFCA